MRLENTIKQKNARKTGQIGESLTNGPNGVGGVRKQSVLSAIYFSFSVYVRITAVIMR